VYLLLALQGIAPWFLLAGRLCEVLAGMLFAWGRIKPLYPAG